LGSSTWGTSGSLARSHDGSLSMGSLNWDLLGGSQNDSNSKLHQLANNGQQQMNTASSFLSLSPLPVNDDGNTWGTSRFGRRLNGLGGSQLTSTQTSVDGSNVPE